MLQLGKFHFDRQRPLVMGIVNLTPDSLTGDGVASNTLRAIQHAREQWEAGADILDIGAESSRPGAVPTPLDEELARLLPVLEVVGQWGIPVSVDTYKPEVMRQAIAVGAAMINDISGMTNPDAIDAVAQSDCGVCIMHMQGQPLEMQLAPHYEDVVAEVDGFLSRQAQMLEQRGVPRARIVLDPGFGFGKTLAHNLQLFQALPTLVTDYPSLVGVSRKSMLGAITGRSVSARMPASLAAAVMAANKGAAIIRVHDVAATVDALKVWRAIEYGE